MLTTGLILLIFLIMVVLFRLMMNGFRNRRTVHTKTPSDAGFHYEAVRYQTKNNRSLYGWWIFKNVRLPSVILVHGWGRNVERMLPYIQNLYKDEFNLLAFDSRHHGSSDKDRLSTMKKFAEDILSSVDFVQQKTGTNSQKIGIVGLSIGGAASLYASARDQRIQSVVTVGAFANPLDVMKLQLAKRHVPYIPVGWSLLKYLEFLVGFRFNDIAPEKHIGNSNAQVLLIHGTHDRTIPFSHAERLLAHSKNGRVNLWKIEGRGHSDCHQEKEYWTRIRDFLHETLK